MTPLDDLRTAIRLATWSRRVAATCGAVCVLVALSAGQLTTAGRLATVALAAFWTCSTVLFGVVEHTATRTLDKYAHPANVRGD